MNLNNLSLAALTSIRNDLAGTPNGGKFKIARDKAADVVLKLAKQKGVNVAKQYNEDGQRVAVEQKAPKAKGKKEKPAPKEKGPIIRVEAEKLLLKVVGKDADGRAQGMPYADILIALAEIFPDSNTSVACLRWYAVRMRERGDKVPNRPRAQPQVEEA